MEITYELLFAIIGELTVQARVQARMLQQIESEKTDASPQRTIPDYQAWRTEHPDSDIKPDRKGSGGKGNAEVPKGEVM
jgi:hypothetical protein